MKEMEKKKKNDCCPHCGGSEKAEICSEYAFVAKYRKFGESHERFVGLFVCLDCGTVYVPQTDLADIKEKI